MKGLKHILLLLLVSILTSCDATIHEYPDTTTHPIVPVIVPVTLNLEFDTNMPLYQQVEHTRNTLTDADFDLRYIVQIYRASEYRQIGGELVARHVFSKEEVDNWNNTVEFELEKGYYDFIVWADYVDAGTTDDKYYNTSNFSLISIIGNISGSNDYRDAFIGYGKFDLTSSPAPYVYTIPMERPLAKYRYISNDLDSFISRMLAIKKQRLEQNRAEGDDDTKGDTKVEINLADYYVEFQYQTVSTAYNALMGIPAAPLDNLSFRSNIKQINDTEAEIGFDYIFVSDDTKVWISLNIYEEDDNGGIKLGGVDKFLVPLSRGKLTEVRGMFLTSEEEGGVGINPDFDGEFTLPI